MLVSHGAEGESCPVEWAGRRAVVTLPGHMGLSNAGLISDRLLSVISQGAEALIADMTTTRSCHHAGAAVLARAHHRAVVSGTELRIVVTDQTVGRMLSLNGLDRLVSIYPSLEAAMAAGPPALSMPMAAAMPDRQASVTTAAIWNLVDALQDGVALTDERGVLVLANVRLEEMFGYRHAELAGRPVETLVPVHLRAARRAHRDAYARTPAARRMGAGARLVGLRKDGTTFPAEISLSQVTTATGTFTLTVVRDVTGARQLADLAQLVWPAAGPVPGDPEMRDSIVASLDRVRANLRATEGMPSEAARQTIAQAIQQLDETIRHVRGTALAGSN